MKNTLHILTLTLIVGILFTSCQKEDVEKKHTVTVTATYLTNTLKIPVYYQAGFTEFNQGVETTMLKEKILIRPGETVPYLTNAQSNFTRTNARTSVLPLPNTIYIHISDKIKKDYNCNFLTNVTARQNCQEDSINFFIRNNGWKEIYDADKDSISSIYSIGVKDSLEAK